LTTMRSQIGHLSSLIDDLFELAQTDAGALRLELQRAAIADIVSDAIEGMHPQAVAKGVRLEGSVAAGIAPLLIATQKIERVLYNLVTNAIRHTPSDGVVTISVMPGDRRQETRDKRQETRDKRQETGDKRQELGMSRVSGLGSPASYVLVE